MLLYIVVAAAHAYLAPLTTGPDELAHYEYARFIADHGRLPQNYTERDQASYKSDQPPLYHLITALPAAWVDVNGSSLLKRVTDHPRRQLIERTRHAWGLYNTEDERWPYRGEVLRWQIGRWIAILFGAATVAVTFFMARDVFDSLSEKEFSGWYRKSAQADSKAASPPKPARFNGLSILAPNFDSGWVALAAAAVVAFIPRFVLTGSMLNYETTLAFFSALFLWLLLRMENKNKLRITLYAMLVGLFAGLAITTKLSAIVFPPEIVGDVVVAEGVWTANELTMEQTKEVCAAQAREEGKDFDEDEVTTCMTLYQISGTGAVVAAK